MVMFLACRRRNALCVNVNETKVDKELGGYKEIEDGCAKEAGVSNPDNRERSKPNQQTGTELCT